MEGTISQFFLCFRKKMPKVRLREGLAKECKKHCLRILRQNSGLCLSSIHQLISPHVKINKANLIAVLQMMVDDKAIVAVGEKPLFSFRGEIGDKMEEDISMSISTLKTPRNEIINYRNKITEVLGCVEHIRRIKSIVTPKWLSKAICQAVLHIRIPLHLKVEEWHMLMEELAAEGVIELSKDKNYLRKGPNFINTIHLPDDFSAPGRRENEEPYEGYLRRLINRLDEHLQREYVLLKDIECLYSIIEKHFTGWFNAMAFYPYLPDEWKIDKRRSLNCYLNTLLFELNRQNRIHRDERTNLFSVYAIV